MTRLKKSILAGLALLGLATVAFALPDQTRNFPGRLFATQQTHYQRITVNFNDPNIGSSTAPKIFALPPLAYITNVEVEVVTAFNAGTTNNLTFGTTATNANEIVANTDLPGGGGSSISTGTTRVNRAFGRGLTSATADTTIFAKYTQTGGAATTGQAVLVISYAANNDQ